MGEFRYIELFAGIGGFRVALDALGATCVFASELSVHSKATYEHNFGDKPQGDITKIDAATIPPFDLLTGGFPCQSFTGIGLQKGFDDDRGMLFYEVIRILKYHQPRALLLENVKGLLTLENGKIWNIVKEALSDAGYDVSVKLINSKCLLPQFRNRVYIVGFLKSLKSQNHFRFPPLPLLPRCVRDILEDEDDPFLDFYTLSDSDYDILCNSRNWRKYGDQQILKLTDEEGGGPGGKHSESNTLISSYYKSLKSFSMFVPQSHLPKLYEGKKKKKKIDRKFVLGQGRNPRWLTPRECCRLQGFPDNFKPHPNLKRFYEQIGNAVSPPIVAAIAGSILSVLALQNCESNEISEKCKVNNFLRKKTSSDWEREGIRVALFLVLQATSKKSSERQKILSYRIHLPFGKEPLSLDCKKKKKKENKEKEKYSLAQVSMIASQLCDVVRASTTKDAFVGTIQTFLQLEKEDEIDTFTPAFQR
eukprot:g5738.t1